MKALLLCLLLCGCVSATKPDDAIIQLCAVQIVRVVDQQTFVSRMHCEPDGEKS